MLKARPQGCTSSSKALPPKGASSSSSRKQRHQLETQCSDAPVSQDSSQLRFPRVQPLQRSQDVYLECFLQLLTYTCSTLSPQTAIAFWQKFP